MKKKLFIIAACVVCILGIFSCDWDALASSSSSSSSGGGGGCGYSSTGHRWYLYQTSGGVTYDYTSDSACHAAASEQGYTYYCYDGKCYGYYVK